MRPILVFHFMIASFLVSCNLQKEKAEIQNVAFVAPLNNERMRLFDDGWRFSKEEDDGAINPDYDDHLWRKVDLPHDWSIEDLDEGDHTIGPFSKESPGGVSTGFTMGGIGFYRKNFTISPKDQGKIFSIYFDGVYMESDVWINGHHLGFHPNGYTPFYYELTDYLNPPEVQNVLVVRAKNLGENSRWYAGSGIYRHVWLRVTDPLNIPVWGVFIKTLDASEKEAEIEAELEIQNQGNSKEKFSVEFTIVGEEEMLNTEFPVELEPGKRMSLPKYQLKIENPELWSPPNPKLYTLRTEIKHDGKVIDHVDTKLGIRTLGFSPDRGFLLNGQSIILKGGCLHHDNGILGAATFDRAEQRRVELMKENGFNAIRTSHNPPSQQFLDACDRVGILVLDEAFDRWEHPKKPNDYHRFFKNWYEKDIQSMVLRDRNHPSIFAWSYGNEIYERADSSGIRIAKQLIRAIKEKDKTRPVTQAICGFWDAPYERPWSDTEIAFKLMDIHGYNYKWQEYESDHHQFPDRIIVGTESFPKEAYENYRMAIENSYVLGDFVWTGMDYLGEAGIGQASLDSVNMVYPWFNGYCGDIDLIGHKKPQSFYRDVVWGRSELEMAVERPAPEGHQWVISNWGWRDEMPCWNWDGHEGELLDVYVYSPADSVDLYVNDQLKSRQIATDSSKFIFDFKVPYEKGELKAIAYIENKELEKSISTTGMPVKVNLQAEREGISTNKDDLAYVHVNLVDDEDRLVMNDDRLVHFEVRGEADLLGVGNGNPKEMKSFQADSCRTFHGRCLVVLRPNGNAGKVQLIVRSSGQITGETTLQINSPQEALN